jgi:hypothetical protein
MPDKLRVYGPHRSFAHRAKSLQVNLFIPREEIAESFISSYPCTGVSPFPEANLGKLQVITEVKRVSGRSLSRLESGMCFLSTKVEIFSVRGHSLLVSFQSDQLLRHVLVGRVNRNIPVHPIHLQSLLNVFDGSREHV